MDIPVGCVPPALHHMRWVLSGGLPERDPMDIPVGCVPPALRHMRTVLSGGLPERDPLNRESLDRDHPGQRPPDRDNNSPEGTWGQAINGK